ncbi:MAG: zinc-dependent dehydrogenase [Clostridiaceae bacterium]|nr:zinc-dependent dehydrogenase [Clostridiaceae bacterium]
MKAAVLEDIGKLRIVEREVPLCGDQEILIRVMACGICRTDMKCVTRGQRDLRTPRVLGHELTGSIVKIGREVQGLHIGDRIQVAPGIACGSCDYCRKGEDNLCNDVQIIGFHYDGGFQEYMIIPEASVKNGSLNVIPEYVTYIEAAYTEPLACSINIQDALKIDEGENVLIFGAGRLGILNLKLAKARGANRVIVVETDAKRLKTAEKYPFDYIIDPNKKSLEQQIKQITKGKGVDAAIPCCSEAIAMEQSLEAVRKRGKIGFFSGLMQGAGVNIDFNKVHYKELSLIGAYGCSKMHNQKALEMIAAQQVIVKDIDTQRITLEEIQKGIQMVQDMTDLSVMIIYE